MTGIGIKKKLKKNKRTKCVISLLSYHTLYDYASPTQHAIEIINM